MLSPETYNSLEKIAMTFLLDYSFIEFPVDVFKLAEVSFHVKFIRYSELDKEKSVNIIVNGKVHTVDWRTVTKIIKANKDYYPGKPIRLFACNTGKTDDGFAQNLANKLNTTVYAPRTIIWANSDGSYYIADRENSPRSEYQDFKKFIPRRKK